VVEVAILQLDETSVNEDFGRVTILRQIRTHGPSG
jgi:hypothetical protein